MSDFCKTKSLKSKILNFISKKKLLHESMLHLHYMLHQYTFILCDETIFHEKEQPSWNVLGFTEFSVTFLCDISLAKHHVFECHLNSSLALIFIHSVVNLDVHPMICAERWLRGQCRRRFNAEKISAARQLSSHLQTSGYPVA